MREDGMQAAEFFVVLLCVRGSKFKFGRLVVSTYCVPGPHTLRGTCHRLRTCRAS